MQQTERRTVVKLNKLRIHVIVYEKLRRACKIVSINRFYRACESIIVDVREVNDIPEL